MSFQGFSASIMVCNVRMEGQAFCYGPGMIRQKGKHLSHCGCVNGKLVGKEVLEIYEC